MYRFSNGGFAVLPYAITQIADRDGAVLYERKPGDLGRVISEEKRRCDESSDA